MNRPLTETEKTIIGRDATEQRSLSAELNGRASAVGALFAINIGLVYQTNMFMTIPIVQMFLVVLLAGAAFFMFWLSRGREYGYTQPADAWVEWSDERAVELGKSGFDVAALERELSDGYWRTLAKTAKGNRDNNRYKSQVIKSAAALSLTLICLVLLVKLLSSPAAALVSR